MVYLFAIQKINGIKATTILDSIQTFDDPEQVRDYCLSMDGSHLNEVLAHYVESDAPLTSFQIARRLMQYPYFVKEHERKKLSQVREKELHNMEALS